MESFRKENIMAIVYKEVEVDVDITDFAADELVAAVEELGYYVYKEEHVEGSSEKMKDEIYSLYRDYINGANNFDNRLKRFFEDQLGILVN